MKNTNFTIALDRDAHQWAKTFAAQQTTPAKGRRVYLNTLAICAVQRYLDCVCQLQLNLGDAGEPISQGFMDVADLIVPGLGKIECRPILPGETVMLVPPESIDDRIGYVAVQFNESLSQVELLGCVATLTSESIALKDLLPIENLIDLVMPSELTTNLSEVLAGIFHDGWASINYFVSDDAHATPRELVLRNITATLSHSPYESIHAFTAGKMIDLKIKLGNISLLLLLGLSKEPDGRMKVRVRLYSAGQEMQLPANMQLILQDDRGQVKRQVYYAEPMNFIQLNYFRLETGSRFGIRISFEEYSLTELFVA